MLRILETITSIKVLRGLPTHLKQNILGNRIPFLFHTVRTYSDTQNSDNSKKVLVKVSTSNYFVSSYQGYRLSPKSAKVTGPAPPTIVNAQVKIDWNDIAVPQIQGTDTKQRLRVRLARPSDIPRVQQFVREHARVWPGPLAPPSNLIVGDYVARILAQGHSMIAERQPTVSRSAVLGLALSAAVYPWDPDLLERWARCVRCTRSRRLINFTAHCLRAPKLHDAYGVRNILQVILIVPPDTPKSAEIVNVLAKNAIKRGKETGFPLVRFDISKESDAKVLEELKLKMEWFVSYKIINVAQMEDSKGCKIDASRDETSETSSSNFVSVYTARLNPEKNISK